MGSFISDYIVLAVYHNMTIDLEIKYVNNMLTKKIILGHG